MRLKALAAGLAATAVLGAGAGVGAAASAASLTGTYIATINGARWTLNIKSNGTFNAASRGTGVSGRIVLAAKQARFSNRKGCPVSAGVGTYSYNLVRQSLTFAVIKDPCAALTRVLKTTRWQRVT
jgi:hypothetical protein